MSKAVVRGEAPEHRTTPNVNGHNNADATSYHDLATSNPSQMNRQSDHPKAPQIPPLGEISNSKLDLGFSSPDGASSTYLTPQSTHSEAHFMYGSLPSQGTTTLPNQEIGASSGTNIPNARGTNGHDELANETRPTVTGRKTVQFHQNAPDGDRAEDEHENQQPVMERGESSKPQSIATKIRGLARWQTLSHTRSPSGASNPRRSMDGREMDGYVAASPDHPETGLSAAIEDADSDAHADASGDESTAEVHRAFPMSVQKKRKRKGRAVNEADTAPTSPHSPLTAGPHSAPMDEPTVRPLVLPRSVTDAGMTGNHQGLSEDENRREGTHSPGWTPRHPLRGLSYGGARKGGEDGHEPRRPLNLLNMSHGSSAKNDSPAETPRTSRRKMLTERSTTATAQRWRQVTNRLRLIGQSKKKERKEDHQKSAELLAELTAGSPAALILASMFQRDEHGDRRIPVLLEQLKVKVTDSEVDKSKEADNPTPGDKHLIFKIELEYGSGINRMKWVVKRSIRDFANLHIKYKLHYSSEKLKGRGESSRQLPRFPRSAFPYPKAFSGLDDEEEEEEEGNTENEQAATDTEQHRRHHPHLGFHRRRSSAGAGADPTAPGKDPRADLRAKEKQRKKLETYLQAMIKFMLFRADSNRLCKFLEISALGVRLATEGSYHGKEGFLVIRSAKGLDFRKALTPANLRNRHTPKWFLVRHSYVVCVDSPEEMHIYDVFLFDPDFRVQSSKPRSQTTAREFAEAAHEAARHPQHHRLKLSNSERKLKLLARNERQLFQFEESIRLMVEQSPWARQNRFDSFAPIRSNCFAQWLVDGRDHMWVVSRALNQAKDVIYIHDWWLSPELYMRRPPAISQKWRLDRLLKRKAEEGVKIFVIVYRNIESAIPIDSSYTKFSLLDLHPNVFVQRSPNQFRQNTFFWAHHEKLVIIDHTIAFVGGIDLCFGRWDTPQHPLTDDKPTGFETGDDQPRDADHCQLWPGKDYSNPRVQDFYALNKPYEEMYNRSRVARMPWHDISMQVVGQPARDLTRHFVQRWNYILRQRKPTRPTPFLLPPPDFNAADLEALGLDGTCEVQMLRSAGPWSLGTPDKTEHSIMNAYVKMIEESEHFVYMENQFFISSCTTEGATVHNKIGDAFVERINRAARNDEVWRAVIVIPLVPGFQNTVEEEGGTSVRLIMQYQYRSICRGESSIFGRLRSAGIEPEDYIQFYALRQWGKLGPRQTLVTEQLYIHAKCMVVDDRVAIIGSANINERSMLGNRDSECAAIVRDTDMVWSRMNGEPYKVGRFPHTLRMRLMREHLGLDVDKIMEEAQMMEADRRKMEAEDTKAASPTSPQGSKATPSVSKIDSANDAKERADELRSELLSRAEDVASFNHDVDWEQAGNPNLRANRKLTEDHRVTGTSWHKDDLEGRGYDNMADLQGAGYKMARDTAAVGTGKEILVDNVHTEGKKTLRNPRQPEDELRIPSYVRKMEAPEPPLPPRPKMDRMNTAALGLPMISQLPPLPLVDDTDIGGPPLDESQGPGMMHSHHSLIGELKRPVVDRDCMTDPIHDAFMDDIWHLVAENNTKIYRAVFRCMPDNQVRDWNDYHQYLAYEQRFEQLQGHDPIADKEALSNVKSAPTRSGPPGSVTKSPVTAMKGIAKVPGDVINKTAEMSQKVQTAVGEPNTGEQVVHEKQNLRKWAAEANQAQEQRQHKTLSRRETVMDEKAALQTVPENGQIESSTEEERKSGESSTEPTTSSPPTSAGLDKASTPPTNNNVTVPDVPALPGSSPTPAPVKRRRRGTTRSSRRDFSASDDLMSIDEAEELLSCVQGHLITWPYDWLDKVEAGGNWLFPFDQISPIEIYI